MGSKGHMPVHPDDDNNFVDSWLEALLSGIGRVASRSKRIYQRLFAITKKRKNGVTNSTREKILEHLSNENLSDEWFRQGKLLLRKAEEEETPPSKKSKKTSRKGAVSPKKKRLAK